MDREFTVTLDDTEYSIEMQGNTVLVNGQLFVVGLEERGVTVDGTLYEVTLESDRAAVNGIPYNVAIAGLETARLAVPAAAAAREDFGELGRAVAEGAGVIKAIMPGKVLRVLLTEGEKVQEGEVAVILEAMKMENELRADRSGTVTQVAVAAGDDVELGQVLVVIEQLG